MFDKDMKVILESFDAATEECGGGMPPAPMPQEDPVTMNVNLNARGKDAIEDLLDIMKDKETSTDSHVSHNGHDDMKRLMALSMDKPEMEDEDEEVDEWDNEPDTKYQDTEYMTKDIAGGLNRQKKSHPPTNGGDNPMALEQSIKEELWKALSEKKKCKSKMKKKY